MKGPTSNPHKLPNGYTIASLSVVDGRAYLPKAAMGGGWREITEYCHSNGWAYDDVCECFYTNDPDLVKYPIISVKGG